MHEVDQVAERLKRTLKQIETLTAERAAVAASVDAVKQSIAAAVIAGDDPKADRKALTSAEARLAELDLALAELERQAGVLKSEVADAERVAAELALAAELRRCADVLPRILAAAEALLEAVAEYGPASVQADLPADVQRELRALKERRAGFVHELRDEVLPKLWNTRTGGRRDHVGRDFMEHAEQLRRRAGLLDGSYTVTPRRAIVPANVLLYASTPIEYRSQTGDTHVISLNRFARVPAVVARAAVRLGAGAVIDAPPFVSIEGLRTESIRQGDDFIPIALGQRRALRSDHAALLIAAGAARIIDTILADEDRALRVARKLPPLSDPSYEGKVDLGRVDDLIDAEENVPAPVNLERAGRASQQLALQPA